MMPDANLAEALDKPLPTLPVLDARVPAWRLERLQLRSCPFCAGESAPVLLRPDRIPVAYCGDCGLWYACRVPPEEEIAAYYRGYWHHVRPAPLGERDARYMLQHARRARSADLRLRRVATQLGGLQGRRLLEVGCGRGDLLLQAKCEGADVVGVDLSPEACTFARQHLGIPMFQAELADCADEIAPVDAVMMNDLIEHPLQPRALLGAAARLLRPGGLLLMWTPNGGGAGENLASALRWVGFRVDLEHLQYLSTRTVIALARGLDLEILHLETLGYPALDGIDRPPQPQRRRIGQVPGLRKVTRLGKALAARLKGKEERDPREGDYHLFAVLRKPQRP